MIPHACIRFGLAVMRYSALVFVATVLLLPIYWLVLASFRPAADIFATAGTVSVATFLPERLTFEHWREAWSGELPRAVANSLFVALTTVALGVTVNSLAGFAFAVFEFPGKRLLFVLVLATFMMPFESIVIPLYVLVRGLGLTDTYAALILPEVASGLVIFLFRQFFAAVPKELYEAARVDGASWLQIWWRLTLPLSGPTIATASLMLFVHQWDAFFWPLVAAPGPERIVVQVAIARNVTLEVANWGGLFASASTAILLALVPFLLLQRFYLHTIASAAER
ncbi:MAG: carbohydrate ABC transporter permease [Geminicoccaceae bacterium]|nr:carbohydrate ABC transporter permease [Geminicoccaceae bacterium]MCS7269335.1 carbohydrate ABC transporter permease [Geminicoccaceae bacterium]MCX7630985.1 carbohydrate ABC transporter permease [Geminicoccaceae bacterium]MDW8126006.1 carbohydrate ABC transporter permease [Geminicoccaceae bacterium]MDW8342636.1 carbohydrate ABC transporter permease [Geminicoccaceae bacterium]